MCRHLPSALQSFYIILISDVNLGGDLSNITQETCQVWEEMGWEVLQFSFQTSEIVSTSSILG